MLQTTWYDEMPPTVGVAWAARPSDAAWQAITPMPGSTWQGNWKGRPSLTAYRTHGGQPFHYVLRMYDERGRLASMVRYTENVGFDGVYYAYNAMNRIVSVHVVDPSKQHATWYTYDASGRVSSMATRSSDAG
ncbi:MAG: hypothetical protein J0I17_13515, partial ['Candidatus Kapabacteria' thiocyanatum]|nr:hypothetical protein ['Candidatus Kapabacteria' thiocyanatum]